MTSNRAGIPWLRVLTEGAVIVLSILLAFAIDAGWTERQERNTERVTLEALREEFAGNLTFFQRGHEVHQRLADDASRLLVLLTDAPSGSRAEVPDSLLASLVTFLTLEARTGTLNTLLASGEIGLIRDRELQQALAAWPAHVANTAEMEVGVRDIVLDVLIPGLADHVDLSGVLAARTPAGLFTDRSFSLAGTTYQMNVNPISRSLVGERHFVAQMLLTPSRGQIREAEVILALIDRNLPR